MLTPFNMPPRAGGGISAADLAAVFELAYRTGQISAVTPDEKKGLT